MQRLVTFFSTLRCTVILFMAIALICVAGTVIPQHAGAPVSGQGMSAWFVARLQPTDLYHSLWLALPAGLLCLNLLMCMRVRIRARKRGIPAPRFGGAEEISLAGQCQAIKDRILETAPRALRFQEQQEGDSILLFGDSDGFRRPAIFGLHASVVLIFAGMLLSAFGIDGHIELGQGQSSAQYVAADGTAAPLGFQMRCDQFRVTHYPNGMPKEYVSRLTFLENGVERAGSELRVNHPISYRGLRFYQESYRGRPAAIFTVTDGDHAWSVTVREGDELVMDDGKLRFQAVKIGEDVMHMGPALKLVFEHAQGPRTLWLFQEIDRVKEAVPNLFERAPSFNPGLIEPYTFTLMEIAEDYVTGIGVKRDPGAPVVAGGGALMLVCLLIVFLVPGMKVWVRLEERQATTTFKAAASRGGRPEAFPAAWMARIRLEGDA